MIRISRVAPILLIAASLAAPAAAQSTVTQSDIQRLQDNAYLADRDVADLRARDAGLANQLSTQLTDLKDEVVYLKVKLRKEQTLSRGEYNDVRDRIEDVRSRARSGPSTASAPSGGSTGGGFGGNRDVGPSTERPRTQTSTRTLPRGTVEIPSEPSSTCDCRAR